MRNLLILFLLVQLLMAAACTAENNGIMCTMEARAGLNVSVSLENVVVTTPEGITVTAVDGDFSETLMNIEADKANFFGVFERTGTYIVSVTKSGYKTFVSEPITVTADECHVMIGEIVNVQLEAA